MGDLKTIINQRLKEIYLSLYKREFKKTEKSLLTIIDYFLSLKFANSEKKQVLSAISILYHNFNSCYLQWVKTQKGNIKKEIKDLSSNIHDNFLLAQCRDPAAMDDFLKELEEYFNDDKKTQKKQDILYHLNCYKRIKY